MTNFETPRPFTADLDLYKLTMGDMAYNLHPDVDVTFTLNNRNLQKGQRISDVVPVGLLQDRFDETRERGFQEFEVNYMNELPSTDGERLLTPGYVSFLSSLRLPDVFVGVDSISHELAVSTEGKWPAVSLWETAIMAEVSQLYGEKTMEHLGISKRDLMNEGNRKLTDKIALLKNHPEIKFADFGTRRRTSYDWHEHAVERLATELADNFVGTSNPYLAHKFGLKAIGTYAHEMAMIYAAIEDVNGGNPLDGEQKMLRDWESFQRGTLLTGLPDTFTSRSFFARLQPDQWEKWAGFRQDSGDPIDFANQAIHGFKQHGIDPMTKNVLFSDALTFSKAIDIAKELDGKINYNFGIGGYITNDVHAAVPKLNIVAKATNAAGVSTVKLSDDPGKHTGSSEQIDYYNYLTQHSQTSQRIQYVA